MQANTGTDRGVHRLLVFDLCGQTYGLPVEQVQEITFMAELSIPAGLPPILHGFLTVSGTAIAVLHLRRLFALPDLEPTLHTPLILLRGECPVALMVDRVLLEATVPAADLRAVDAQHSINGCVQAEVSIGERQVHLLAAERLLLEKERRCLADLQSREQQRLHDLEAGAG